MRLLLLTLREGTCHIPGVPLEAGLGLSGDLDPGADAALGGVQREFSLSGAVLLLLLMTVAVKKWKWKTHSKTWGLHI